MSAAADLDFKVTPQEFTAYAGKSLHSAGHHNDGAFSKDEVPATCPAKS